MRPIHLGLAVLFLAAAMAALWFSLDRLPGVAHAGASDASGAVIGTGGSLSDDPSQADTISPDRAQARIPLAPPEADTAAAAAAPKSSDKPLLSGRVIDPGGESVAGATVFASSGVFWLQIPLDVEPEGVPKGWIRVERTTTDAEGRYTFNSLKPGALRIAVRAGGFAPRYEDHLDLPDRPETTLPDLRLERGVVLSGRVVDREGKGVSGAVLLAALEGSAENKGSMVSLPGRGVPLATTDPEGAFRIDQLAAGPWRLIVDAPGQAISEEEGRTERAGEQQSGLVFRVERGFEILGRVRGEDGALPEGLRISARPSPEREAGRNAGRPASEPDAVQSASDARARHALCAADGSFTVRGVKADVRYSLSAWQKSEDPGGWKRMRGIEAVQAFGGQRGVELTYKPESALVFRVLDARTSAPLTIFTVFAGVGREQVLRDEKGEVVRSFPEGRARYGELRPRRGGPGVVLRIAASGFKDLEKKDIPLSPGQELDLGELRFEPEHTVVVRVVDDTGGKPVEGARVLLGTKTDEELGQYLASPPDQDWWGEAGVRFARTGPDGRARLSSLPGKMVTARARAKGFLSSEPLHVLLPEDRDLELELRLHHGGTVVVTVHDSAGHLVEGVGIEHRSPTSGGDEESFSFGEAAQKTDAQGIARFEALAPGVHGFRVSDRAVQNGWADGEADSQEPGWVGSVAAEGSRATLDFLAQSRGGLFGQVREGGRPLEGVSLHLSEIRDQAEGGRSWFMPGSNDPYTAVTDHAGRYHYENLRCGSYTLQVSHASRRMPARFTVSIENPSRSFDVDLDVASIEGRVTGEDGAPLGGIDVQALNPQVQDEGAGSWRMVLSEDDRGSPRLDYRQETKRAERTDANGRYSLRGLRTGEALTVYASGDTVQPGSSPEITLGPDEARRGVDFVLKDAGAIEVALLGDPPGGRGGGWYQVRAMQVKEDGQVQVVQQNYLGSWNRTCRLRSLAPGKYKVECSPNGNPAGARSQEQEVEVVARQSAKITFQAR